VATDHSPVRASAQEQREIAEEIVNNLIRSDEDALTDQIVEIIAAAEARGRQQAEQEKDWAEQHERLRYEAEAKLEQAEQALKEAEEEAQYEHDRFKKRGGELDKLDAKVAALTQALKDYGEHPDTCAKTFIGDMKCSCGLDAALTGAQK